MSAQMPTAPHRRSRPISGLGPHGEFPASVDQLRISADAEARARTARYAVSVVLHSPESDWARLQLDGVRATLERFGAELLEVAYCGFEADRQVGVLESIVDRRPDAIISIPLDTLLATDAHRRIAEAGIKLVLMDNAPAGMMARKDYVSVVSADNFGNGEIAAEILAAHVPQGGSVLVVGYGTDFPVTNERELGFRRWFGERRQDATIRRTGFGHPDEAGEIVSREIGNGAAADALFVVWDEPALLVAAVLQAHDVELPITTIDLGLGVALEVARGGLIKGGGAQLPYDQGVAEATAAIMALVGEQPPPWIALPAMPVTRSNVVAAYEAIWHRKAPDELVVAASRRELGD